MGDDECWTCHIAGADLNASYLGTDPETLLNDEMAFK
jgi:hypothetical protein